MEETEKLLAELDQNKVYSKTEDGCIYCRVMVERAEKEEYIKQVRGEAGKSGMSMRWHNKRITNPDNKTITNPSRARDTRAEKEKEDVSLAVGSKQEVLSSKEKTTATTPVENQTGNQVILKERKLTDIQSLVESYKTVKGFEDIPDWNKINFAMHTKPAKNILLMVKGDLVIAMAGIKRISRKMDSKGLSWNLSTVVRMFPDWLIERAKDDYDAEQDTE